MSLVIQSLFYYPLKGCAGISVSTAKLGESGLHHDREYVLVDKQGRFLSQRNCPQLSQFVLSQQEQGFQVSYRDDQVFVARDVSGRKTIEVSIWKDKVSALDCGEELATAFSDWVGAPVRLAKVEHQHRRTVNSKYTDGRPVSYGFADGFPFLIISQESLNDLNQRLGVKGKAAIAMNRFRPNIVFAGGEAPYLEDQYTALETEQGLRFRLAKPCTRCSVTTIDQQTGTQGVEPLKTLSEYRLQPEYGGIIFGQNAYLESPLELKESSIRIGESLQLCEKLEYRVNDQK